MQRNVEVTAKEWAAGEATISKWELGGGNVQTYGDTFLACMVNVQRAERLVAYASAWNSVRGGTLEALPLSIKDFFAQADIGGHLDEARAVTNAATGPIDVAYLAALGSLRAMLRPGSGWSQVASSTPLLGMGGGAQLGFPFAVVAWGLVGLAAVAGATWFGADRNTSQLEAKKFAITADVHQYLKQAELAAAAGQPIPDPPSHVKALAAEEERWSWIAPLAGVAVAGFVVSQIWRAMASPKATPVRVVNPSPLRKRRRRASPQRAAKPRIRSRVARPKAKSRRAVSSSKPKSTYHPKMKPPTAPKKRRNPKPKSKERTAKQRRGMLYEGKRNPKGGPRITGKNRQVMAIAANAYPGSTNFNNADERRAVTRLDKAGLMKITSKGKYAGMTELNAGLTAKGKAALERAWGHSIRNPKRDKIPKRKPATSKTVGVRMRKNPIRAGHSQATVSKNIGELKRSGYSEAQSSAIALRSARAGWRKKTPQGAFPRHLETKAERAGNKRNPSKKKAAPKKKANPRKWSPPKGKTTRAMFFRKQQRNGASKKQAQARWNFKQQAKKRNPARPKASGAARRRNARKYKPRLVKLAGRIGSYKLVVPPGEYDDTFDVFSPSGAHIGRVTEVYGGGWDAMGPGGKDEHGYKGQVLTTRPVKTRKHAVEIVAGVKRGNPKAPGGTASTARR